MEIAPEQSAFAARYSAGAPQLVSTTLVADLETPVSAFLKLAGGKKNAFLFESVEGGAVRGRYSIIGLEPDLVWRTNGSKAEINRGALGKPAAFVPCPEPPLAGAARADRREPDRDSRRAAADGRRRVRLSRLRHGAADGETAGAEAGPDRHSRRGAGAPDHRGDFRRGAGQHYDRHARAPRCFRERQGRARPRSRAPERGGRRAGKAARQAIGGRRDRPDRGRRELQHHGQGIRGHGAAGQGIHPGRRYLPSGAVAALRGAVQAPAVFALSRAAAREPGAVSLLSRLRRLRGRRIEPGNPGARARRQGDRAPDRRHQAARRHPARGQGAGRRIALRPQGARRASHAARSGPQRRRARIEDWRR